MNRKATLLAMSVMMALAAGGVARASSPITLSIEGPTTLETGAKGSYAGQLSLDPLGGAVALGLGSQTVDIFRDLDLVATVTTDDGGRYSAEVPFPTPGTFALVARAYRGTVLEVSSQPLMVTTTLRLAAVIVGSGSGSVSSSPAGIQCPGTCDARFPAGSTVILRATASAGSALAAWSSCGSVEATCEVSMGDARTETVRFVDVQPPATPSLIRTVPVSPSSSSTSPEIHGSAEAGSTVRIYGNPTCSGSPLGVGPAGSGSFSITVIATADATTAFRATATDPSGNVSTCTPSALLYTHDSISPAAPTFAGTSPVSPSNSTTPTIHGSAEPGTMVRIYTNATCGGSPIATGIASSSGTFSIGVSVAPNSTTTLRARAIDAVGNLSACSAPISYLHQS